MQSAGWRRTEAGGIQEYRAAVQEVIDGLPAMLDRQAIK